MSSTALSNVRVPRTDWESMFWAVFAASENPMAIADADRWVVSANAALERLLSRAEEEIVGRSIDESLPPADQRTIADRWRAMLARGEGHGVQTLVVDGDVHTTVSYAAHVAHIGGRLVILVVLMAHRERDGAAAGSAAPSAPLTPRELEIIMRIALGATSREIADDLFVSAETVRTQCAMRWPRPARERARSSPPQPSAADSCRQSPPDEVWPDHSGRGTVALHDLDGGGQTRRAGRHFRLDTIDRSAAFLPLIAIAARPRRR